MNFNPAIELGKSKVLYEKMFMMIFGYDLLRRSYGAPDVRIMGSEAERSRCCYGGLEKVIDFIFVLRAG